MTHASIVCTQSELPIHFAERVIYRSLGRVFTSTLLLDSFHRHLSRTFDLKISSQRFSLVCIRIQLRAYGNSYCFAAARFLWWNETNSKRFRWTLERLARIQEDKSNPHSKLRSDWRKCNPRLRPSRMEKCKVDLE